MRLFGCKPAVNRLNDRYSRHSAQRPEPANRVPTFATGFASRVRRTPGVFRSVMMLGAVPWLASCSVGVRTLHVSEPSLEVAPEAGTRELARGVLADPAPLSRLYVPLGQRMGICQIRSAGDWSSLREAMPQLGAEPDFTRGIAIAIISCAGQPLSGDWPISLDSVRVSQGGGYVCANFEGGTYLPDGMSYVDVAHVPGLTDVLMVDVNGVRFYP